MIHTCTSVYYIQLRHGHSHHVSLFCDLFVRSFVFHCLMMWTAGQQKCLGLFVSVTGSTSTAVSTHEGGQFLKATLSNWAKFSQESYNKMDRKCFSLTKLISTHHFSGTYEDAVAANNNCFMFPSSEKTKQNQLIQYLLITKVYGTFSKRYMQNICTIFHLRQAKKIVIVLHEVNREV